MSEIDLLSAPIHERQVIHGQRINPLHPLVNLVFLGVIVWLSVSEGGSWVFALLLILLAPILLQQLALVVWPPRIILEGGVLSLRCGGTRLATPLVNLARFVNHGGTLHVLLNDPRMVLPAEQAPALLETFAKTGAHVRIPGALFSLAQVNIVCRTAGLLEQETDALAERVQGFSRSLHTLTPRLWCVPCLLAVNVIVFLVMAVQSGQWTLPDLTTLIAWGGNYGPRTLDGQAWRLLTSMFIHIGIAHLALNMWALYAIGSLIERSTGNVGFAVVYGLAGLAGSLNSVMWNPSRVSAGASGAIFGLVGALLGFLIHSRDQMPRELWRHLRANATYFVVVNILLGFAVPMIDQAAHIGGLIGGFVVSLAVGTPLSGQSRVFRLLRNVAIAVVGAVLVWQGLRFAPPAPGDWITAEQRLASVKKRLDAEKKAAENGFKQGTLDKAQTLAALKSVLTQWQEERARLEALANLPPELDEQRNRDCETILIKEQGIRALIDDVRKWVDQPERKTQV